MQLRVVFARPSFFLSDIALAITLDGTPIFHGGFMSGVDVTVPVAPGRHQLASALDLAIVKRQRVWQLDVPEAGLAVELAYSRLWGNFAKRLRTPA